MNFSQTYLTHTALGECFGFLGPISPRRLRTFRLLLLSASGRCPCACFMAKILIGDAHFFGSILWFLGLVGDIVEKRPYMPILWPCFLPFDHFSAFLPPGWPRGWPRKKAYIHNEFFAAVDASHFFRANKHLLFHMNQLNFSSISLNSMEI